MLRAGIHPTRPPPPWPLPWWEKNWFCTMSPHKEVPITHTCPHTHTMQDNPRVASNHLWPRQSPPPTLHPPNLANHNHRSQRFDDYIEPKGAARSMSLYLSLSLKRDLPPSQSAPLTPAVSCLKSDSTPITTTPPPPPPPSLSLVWWSRPWESESERCATRLRVPRVPPSLEETQFGVEKNLEIRSDHTLLISEQRGSDVMEANKQDSATLAPAENSHSVTKSTTVRVN